MKIARVIAAGLAAAFASSLLPACSRGERLTVASKNFTEQVVLGEIAAQHLERRLSVPVRRRLNLGGTLLAHQAVVSGEVDLYPEYTGTALTAVLQLPVEKDPAAVFSRVAAEYRKRWDLAVLPPLGFDDTFAMVIGGDVARAERINTLSEAARRQKGWLLGIGYEFKDRPDGLPGLQKVYGLPLRGSPVTMDLGLLYQALLDGKVEMAAANSTDGLLAELDVKVLEDDRHCFPPYEAAFVVRGAALAGNARLEPVLRELSGALSADTMRRLNHEVDGKHRRPADVAREFLDGRGKPAPTATR